MPQTKLVLIQNLKKSCLTCSNRSLAGHGTVRKFNFTFLYMTYDTYSNKLKESSNYFV